MTHSIVHLLNGKDSFTISFLCIGWIVTTQDSKHLLEFLFTAIDFISIPIILSFSFISLVTTLSFQSAWQSAVTSIFSTNSSLLAISKLSFEQNSSFRVSDSTASKVLSSAVVFPLSGSVASLVTSSSAVTSLPIDASFLVAFSASFAAAALLSFLRSLDGPFRGPRRCWWCSGRETSRSSTVRLTSVFPATLLIN